MDYTLGPIPPEEAQELTKEMTALLAKYDAEMQVVSQIQLYKRIPKDIVSPIQQHDLDTGEEKGFTAA